MPSCLAMRVSCAAHSRTCATEPGADCSCLRLQRLDRVDHRDARPLGSERGRDLLELRSRRAARTPAASRPSRRARSATCSPDSSPVTYSNLRGGERAQRLQQQRRLADARIAADQHHLPATRPPPSTRSSSPMPVGMRSSVARVARRKRDVGRPRLASAPAAALGHASRQRAPRRRRHGHGLNHCSRARAALGAHVRGLRPCHHGPRRPPARARPACAQQLVAQRARGRADLVGRQALAPERDRRADVALGDGGEGRR